MGLSGVATKFATGTYTVQRRAAGPLVKGIYAEGDMFTFQLTASIQPVSGRELEDAPEGQAGHEVKVVYSETELRTVQSGLLPGDDFTATSVDSTFSSNEHGRVTGDGPFQITVDDELTALVFPDAVFTAAADDICTLADHGLFTGDGPLRLTTSVADLPLNLLVATDYWIIRLTDDTFKLATSLALALAGTPVNIGDAGTGVHTISDTADTSRPSLALGLELSTNYWIIKIDDDTYKLAESYENAIALTALTIESDGGTQTLVVSGNSPDVILIRGESWLVTKCEPWEYFGSGRHWRAYISRSLDHAP